MVDLESRERGKFTIEAKAQVEFEMEGVECHDLPRWCVAFFTEHLASCRVISNEGSHEDKEQDEGSC